MGIDSAAQGRIYSYESLWPSKKPRKSAICTKCHSKVHATCNEVYILPVWNRGNFDINKYSSAKQNLEDLYRICHTLDLATGESSIIVQLSYNEVKFDTQRRGRYISQFSNLLTYGKEKL